GRVSRRMELGRTAGPLRSGRRFRAYSNRGMQRIGSGRTPSNRPPSSRNQPIAPNPPGASKRPQLEETYPGVEKPVATNSKGLVHTKAAAQGQILAPKDPGWRLEVYNPVSGRQRATRLARLPEDHVEPSTGKPATLSPYLSFPSDDPRRAQTVSLGV